MKEDFESQGSSFAYDFPKYSITVFRLKYDLVLERISDRKR